MRIDTTQFSLISPEKSWRVWLHSPDEKSAGVATAISRGVTPRDTVFKEDDFRLVYRSADYPDILVKINRLPRLKDRLRPWRFAQSEMDSHLDAVKHGVICPKFLGCFEHSVWGIPALNGILVEFLVGYHEISNEEFSGAVTVLKNLYDCGMNHPDFMRRNVMMRESAADAMIIDLEGARFVGKHNLNALLMQTQRFIEYNELGLEHDLNLQFVKTVARQIVPEISETAFFEAVRDLLSRHRSRFERRNLVMDGISLK